MKHPTTRMQGQKGFTLIELLVVIAIIGLLASIVLTSLNTARAKGRDAVRLETLHSLVTALELYASSNSGYPSTGNVWWGTCASGLSKTLSGASGYIPNLAPTYMSTLPTDPKPGSGTGGCDILYNSNGTDYMVLMYGTVETYTQANNPKKRPIAPTENDFAEYTPGAAGW